MPWFLSEILVVLGIILTIAVVAVMLRQRRSPQSSLAWLISILFLPYLAIPLFLMLGQRKLLRRGAIPVARFDAAAPPQPLPEDEASRIDLMLRSYGIPGATTGNTVKVLTTGQEGWQGLTDVIQRAQTTLDIETFIFSCDSSGRKILDLLLEKARSGVKVRLLVDAIGSFHTPKAFFEPLTAAGGQVLRFMPLFHNPLKGRTNLRNHRKITVADSCMAMAGGMNIVSEELSPDRQAHQWSDLAFLVEGPAAEQYAGIFQSDWQFSSTDEPPGSSGARTPPLRHENSGEAVVQVLPSGPDAAFDTIYDTVITAVFEARERLWIITPYFVPDEALNRSLVIACHRGIDVRIVVPDRSNHPLTDLAGASFMREIETAGGTILRYMNGMVHAKALIMDNTLAMAGSANMDLRSFFLNFEVMQLCYSLPEIAAIEAYALRLMTECRRGMPPPGRGRDLLEATIRLGAPLL